jgi:hypothetical protein
LDILSDYFYFSLMKQSQECQPTTKQQVEKILNQKLCFFFMF